MTSKIPLFAGIVALLLALAYTLTAGTIGPVQRYGSAPAAQVAPAVTALDTARQALVSALTEAYPLDVTDQHSYAYNEENYRYGTATCANTSDGQYFTITNLASTGKLSRTAAYAVAKKLPRVTRDYRLVVSTAGGGNVAQIVIRDPDNRKPVATLLAIIPTGSNTIVISGSTASCLPLTSLPATTPKDLVG